ncbi:MAG: alpha/beta fold hydrolase [Cellulosilyticaceae bacterium]
MKLIFRFLTYTGLGIGVLLVLLICVLFTLRWINSQKIKIKTPQGIQENAYIRLGGIDQYIQIRGEDTENPIIVFLHGGPGNTMSHLSYIYQPYLEDQYTFVNWDQRGSGRTYYRNENLDVTSLLSTDILLNDLDELVDVMRERFNQDKVIIMGHSWGTLLGSQYVLAHPDKVLTYIGVGQVVALKSGYVYSAQEALKKATPQGKTKDIEQLRISTARFEKTSTLDAFDFNNFINMQQYTMKYHSYKGQLSTLKMLGMILTSPEFSFGDLKWFLKTSNPNNVLALQAPLLEDCFFQFNLYALGQHYQLPVHYITGVYDVSTPITLLEEYYGNLSAPSKTLTAVPDTGHLLFLDNPQAFSHVITHILEDTALKD